MCIDATWKASFRFFAGIGTMNRWTSRAGRKAPINRTHSKRFALAAESADDASAFGVRASSAPLFQGRVGLNAWAGSWRALSRFFACIGTHEPRCGQRRAGFPACRFTGHSCPVFLLRATGKSPEPADRNVCPTNPRVLESPFGLPTVHWDHEPVLGRVIGYGVPPSGGPDRLKPGHQTGGPISTKYWPNSVPQGSEETQSE